MLKILEIIQNIDLIDNYRGGYVMKSNEYRYLIFKNKTFFWCPPWKLNDNTAWSNIPTVDIFRYT